MFFGNFEKCTVSGERKRKTPHEVKTADGVPDGTLLQHVRRPRLHRPDRYWKTVVKNLQYEDSSALVRAFRLRCSACV